MRILILAALAATLAACSGRETRDDQRSRDSVVTTAVPATPERTIDDDTPPPAVTGDVKAVPLFELPEISEEEITLAVYDDAVDRTYAAPYYQMAPSLNDLFADPSNPLTSQLCWPTTLAYQFEYQRSKRAKPLTKLGTEPASVRHFTAACGTDPKSGTTMPQGAACITKEYEAAGYGASISVIGNDAQWASLGLYPQGTKAEERSVTPADFRTALKADHSVIIMIGYYRFDADEKRWGRLAGHFVSVTGYAQSAAAGPDEMVLRVVNPAVDYTTRPSASSPIKVKRFERPAIAVGLPATGTLTLTGDNIDPEGYLLVVESAIVFDATAL